jgi:hypothetical protein
MATKPKVEWRPQRWQNLSLPQQQQQQQQPQQNPSHKYDNSIIKYVTTTGDIINAVPQQ